ncbi:hypothetical protein COLO4_16544 [Corchorus olitorius]|uniref:Uncharacterized protein n=1 Tax=Corchorus olitorius TaxID=93759 RepID=A0A1R3JGR4_9ROSI|nr:hypothetical protein COLO4_16544 [Corchorus olitorius]
MGPDYPGFDRFPQVTSRGSSGPVRLSGPD